MKIKYLYIFIYFILLNALNLKAQKSDLFYEKSDAFFKNVVIDKKVKYSSITKDKSKLKELTILISNTSLTNLSSKEKKAFLINVYNILVIKAVVDNYPLTSTQKVNGFFKTIQHNVSGNFWTLSHIENEILRKEYDDPRIHFVLNCAALSCPPVTNFAYTPNTLDQQLEKQTELALNDLDFIYTKDGKNYLSKIFQWYKGDFDLSGGVIPFINKYRTINLNQNVRNIFYPYDWMLNDLNPSTSIRGNTGGSFIQIYTPSTLLKKGQIEVQLFNNLYTQTAFRDENRVKQDLNQRQNYFTGLVNFTYGSSKTANWNIGFDVNIKSVRIDTSKSSSPLKVFRFKNDINNRTAIGSIGPVIKFKPFKNSKLTVKSSFLIPVAKDGEANEVDDSGNPIRPWLDWNRFTWWNQFFYDKNLGSKYQIFLEADLLFRFAKSLEKYANNFPKHNLLSVPVSAFLSYFPSEKSTMYVMLQYSPTLGLSNISVSGEKSFDVFSDSDFAQAGVGTKYQITPTLGLKLSYTNFFTSSSGGAGSTFNLGIRYLK